MKVIISKEGTKEGNGTGEREESVKVTFIS